MMPYYDYRWEDDVKKLLGEKDYQKLLEAADSAKFREPKMFDFAKTFGGRIGGNHQRRIRLGGACDRTELRSILSDAFESELHKMNHTQAMKRITRAFKDLDMPNLLAEEHNNECELQRDNTRKDSGYNSEDSDDDEENWTCLQPIVFKLKVKVEDVKRQVTKAKTNLKKTGEKGLDKIQNKQKKPSPPSAQQTRSTSQKKEPQKLYVPPPCRRQPETTSILNEAEDGKDTVKVAKSTLKTGTNPTVGGTKDVESMKPAEESRQQHRPVESFDQSTTFQEKRELDQTAKEEVLQKELKKCKCEDKFYLNPWRLVGTTVSHLMVRCAFPKRRTPLNEFLDSEDPCRCKSNKRMN